ncbi:MAG: hypothetical protein WBP64_01150 [Nitrososphaeraceae archaeon]
MSEMIPIDEKVQNTGGQDIVPLVLYPGRKFEFFGPLFDNLAHLTMALKAVKRAIVVGYSFKDPHIAKIFDLSAKENKDLILFLVSPSACKIYENKLEVIEDPEFNHGFTYRGFNDKHFDTQIPSNLEARVISLPYKFARIFPYLKGYSEKLELARKNEKELTETKQEAHSRIQEWRDCLKLYVECEYMARALKIVQEVSLDVLISDDWSSIFEITFQGLLNALSCNDPLMIIEWKQNLLKISELFAADKFSFDPMIENNIKLDTISNISIKNFANSLNNAIKITENKLSIVNSDRTENIKKLETKIKLLSEYLKPWIKGKLTYEEYYDMRRSKYPEEIQNLQGQIPQYRLRGREDPHIRELVNNIEGMELEKIYIGSILTLD